MKYIVFFLCLLLMTGCSPKPGNQTVLPPNKQTVPTSAASTATTAPQQVFQKIMVVDNEDCAVYIQNLREDPVWGWTLEVQLENKSEDDTYMFSLASASVNGVQVDPLFAKEVTPGKKAKEEFSVWDSLLQQKDIGLYSDIELYFRVYDTDDWTEPPVANAGIHVYPYGAEKVQRYVRQSQPGDLVLADNDAVRVTVTGFAWDTALGYTAELFLENKTEKNVMFTVEDASVNGYMEDPFYARSVGAGNCAFSRMSWSNQTLEELQISQVEQIEFTLRAYDEENWAAEDLLNTQIAISENLA